MASGGGNNEQWAWLGLLKWTLAHSDGTVPSNESPTMMSDEDKAFLEKVMSEGIIDESERMKFILQEFSKAMDYYKSQTEEEKREDPPSPPNEEDLEDLLQELRDIVEQVDYARGFVNLKGCQYLLGAISATSSSAAVVPTEIRNMCLGILSTLAQNNPPVQKEMVELGAIKVLSDFFLSETTPLSTKTRIMQALSAMVRCYDLTEAVFEGLPQAPLLMVHGLSKEPQLSNTSLRTKTLFFLRAFLTSDLSTKARVHKFAHAVAMIANTDSLYLNPSTTSEFDYANIQLRESALSLLEQLLERRLAVTLLLERKQHLASLGVKRIQQLRAAKGDEADSTRVELQHWETFLLLLARSDPEEEPIEENASPKLLL